MNKEIENNDELPIKVEDSLVEKKQEELSIVSDENLLGIFQEIMINLRSDRSQISDLVDTFSNMVINDGDSSTSSKEALVNLIKTKIDATDKMSKIADLMTRIKLKQPDTYQPWMGKKKESVNTINIYDSSGINRKSLLEKIQKEKETK